MVTSTDEVRTLARQQYVDAARKSGLPTFEIVAGDVHRALRLTNRVPLVCNALISRRFLEENDLEIVSKQGPPSGLSTRLTITYRFKHPGRPNEKKVAPATRVPSGFLALRGIGKDVFKKLGGGERFLRSERENFYGTAREPK